MCTFNYSGFGLTIASEIAFPELYPCEGKPDVIIRIAPDRFSFPAGPDNSDYAMAAPGKFYLKICTAAEYFISNGNLITIRPQPSANPLDLRLFTLGTCFGVLLHQRNRLALHGCAIVTESGGIIFCGESGIGKSSLAAILSQHGYPIMSDDICAVNETNEGFVVHPSYPQIKLTETVIHHLHIDTKKLTQDNETGKFYVPIKKSFHPFTTKLKAVVIIKTSKICESYHIEELSGVKKIKAILQNIFRPQYLLDLGKQRESFMACSRLSNIIPIYNLVRPATHLHLQEFSRYVISNFLKY